MSKTHLIKTQKEIIMLYKRMICCLKCVCGTVALQHILGLFHSPLFLKKGNSLSFIEGISLVTKELRGQYLAQYR